jgi:hypothetical protein
VNNEGPELSPEARRIISEARGLDDPTSEDRERVKARWLASVAAIAGVSSLTEAARAAGGVGWGIKAVGAALSLLAGAIGLYVALPSGVPAGAPSEGLPLPRLGSAPLRCAALRCAVLRCAALRFGTGAGLGRRNAREVRENSLEQP